MFTSADTAQVLFGIFIIVYGYLLCLDSYSALGKTKNLPKWTESLFLMVLGVIITFISFGDMMEGCGHAHNMSNCKDTNAGIFLFGVLLMVLGIVDLLNQNIEVFTFSASWVTPAVLVILALLFRSPSTPAHDKEQPEGGHAHADFMGQAFTVSVLSAAVLRALLRVDAERWGVLAAYAWSLAGFAYIAQSRAITDALSFNFTSHTVFLAICVIACVLLIPLLAFIQWATKDAPRTHHRVKDDEVKGY